MEHFVGARAVRVRAFCSVHRVPTLPTVLVDPFAVTHFFLGTLFSLRSRWRWARKAGSPAVCSSSSIALHALCTTSSLFGDEGVKVSRCHKIAHREGSTYICTVIHPSPALCLALSLRSSTRLPTSSANTFCMERSGIASLSRHISPL